ncbi:acyl-CoA dehydrogenase family protein [Streptosporangium sp. NPDC006930]|uniref:acyl-CoA dehydrogenase family protein n=1 Tax=unclassified Streptosporangium TaxID=2632669 RepID=UPI00341B2688
MSGHDNAELLDMMRQVFKDHARTAGPRTTERTFNAELWNTLESLGLTRLTGRESDSGSGAGWPEAAALLATASEHAATVPLAEHDLLAGWLLETAGLPVDNALRSACVLNADGTATAVPWARHVRSLVVLWPDGGTWYAADVSLAEVSLRPGHNIAGEPRDHVTVVTDRLTGVPIADEVVAEFRLRGALARTVQMCGAMEKIVELCVEHTTRRVQFGRPLAKLQAVQQLVSDLAAETSLARAATDAAVRVATESLLSDEALFAVAVARSCVGHASSVVVRNSHQVHGAIGTTAEHDLHLFTTQLLAWRSEFGSVRHWDDWLTDAALTGGADGTWALLTAVAE